MIYGSKNANFTYPVLSNDTHDYRDPAFILDVEVQAVQDDFYVDFEVNLSSSFLKQKIKDGVASYYLVVQGKDNRLILLQVGQTQVVIPKKRLNIKNAKIQLFVKAEADIPFSANQDLTDFYAPHKETLIIPKGAMLGYSNQVIFQKSENDPFDVFEKKVNPTLKSDIKITLTEETILISYKKEELQYLDLPRSHELNYHYVYMGLQRALIQFIRQHGGEEDSVELEELVMPESLLDKKLYELMKRKKVESLNMDNIDEVIYKISRNIIEKHMKAIRGVAQHED